MTHAITDTNQSRALMTAIRPGPRLLLLAAAVLCSLLLALPVAAAPKIREVEYEGRGKVEVEFRTKNVQYKNVKLTVKNSAGKVVKAKIVDQDRDEVEFRILNCKQGEKYTFSIRGLRKKGERKYGSVSGKIRIPKTKGKKRA